MAATLDDMLPILAHVSASRRERHSLTELATLIERSPSYLQRSFSRIVGESPKQFARRLQLECAAALLLTSNDSVLAIALAVGFDSHEGFTRAFAAQFGRSPRAFRRHAHAVGLSAAARQAELITHVGPCLRLFRTTTTTTTSPARPSTMNYDITIQSIDATTFLYRSARCSHAEIAATLAQLLPAVFQYATAHNIQMLGPPTTAYLNWGPGMVTIHAGLPVAPGTRASGEIEVAIHEACEAAVTVHTGPYDGLGDAHAAVEQFIDAQDREAGGPVREVYLTDPGEVPNPDDWKTQIIWPLGPR